MGKFEIRKRAQDGLFGFSAFRLFGFSAFQGHLKYGFIVQFQANIYPQKLRQNASNPQNYFYKKVS
jgi:hypothetical protein